MSRKLLIIIGVIVLVLALGGGAAAYFMMSAAAPEALVEGGEDGDAAAESEEQSELSSDERLDMPALAAPMVIDGRLDHYVFIGIELRVAGYNARWKVIEKLPFIQDAFVREVHERSISFPTAPDTVNVPGLEKRLLKRAAAVAGAENVLGVRIVRAVRARG